MDDDLLFQLDALKRTVDRTAMDLESTRSAVTQLKKDVVDKTNRSGSRFVLLSVRQNLSLTSFVTSSALPAAYAKYTPGNQQCKSTLLRVLVCHRLENLYMYN